MGRRIGGNTMSAELILGIVVAAVAVYGAILSTMTFRAQHRERRARIRVKVSNGFPVLGGHIGEPQLQIEATNTGERPVVLEAAGYKLPRNGDSLALIAPSLRTLPEFPCELAPNRSGLLAEDMSDIAGSLAQHGHVGRVELVGFFRDQEDNEYLAKPWELDINEWLRRAG
jgi:hypothetical protein